MFALAVTLWECISQCTVMQIQADAPWPLPSATPAAVVVATVRGWDTRPSVRCTAQEMEEILSKAAMKMETECR